MNEYDIWEYTLGDLECYEYKLRAVEKAIERPRNNRLSSRRRRDILFRKQEKLWLEIHRERKKHPIRITHAIKKHEL